MEAVMAQHGLTDPKALEVELTAAQAVVSSMVKAGLSKLCVTVPDWRLKEAAKVDSELFKGERGLGAVESLARIFYGHLEKDLPEFAAG